MLLVSVHIHFIYISYIQKLYNSAQAAETFTTADISPDSPRPFWSHLGTFLSLSVISGVEGQLTRLMFQTM